MITIETMRDEDQDLVTHLIKSNLSIFEDEGGVLHAVFRRIDNFSQVYKTEGSSVLVIKDQETKKIIGTTGLGPLAGLPLTEGICEIRDLVVENEHRGKGYGAQLLRAALHKAQELGYNRAYLETTPQMRSAQKLFKSFGFIPVTSKNSGAKAQQTEIFPSYFVLENLHLAS